MHLGLTKKRALVLGSSSGLGLAIAQALSNEGCYVGICSRDLKKAEKIAESMPGAKGFACNLSRAFSGAAVVSHFIETFGGIDILITNAGGPIKGEFLNLKTSDWQQGFQELFLGTIESIREALPSMQKQKWGRILMLTSTSAKEPIPKLTISSSLRAGLLGLAKALSYEQASYGITVNALLPGYTATERLLELGIDIETITSQIPMQRIGKPEELASLVTYLASELASFITGQAIACDGGLIKGIL